MRNCMEIQLRCMLAYYENVFEIGPCFRKEDKTKEKTNGREFILMELQVREQRLEFLMDLLEKFILRYRNDLKFEVISVSEVIAQEFGIRLSVDGEEALVRKLVERYPEFKFEQNFEIILHFIQCEIEPMSKGKCVFFVDYPVSTLSVARHSTESEEIIRRFELFIDGLEISNGYENENDMDVFIERSKKTCTYTSEEKYLVEQINKGIVPINTAVIGVGVERLCMIIHDIDNISQLLYENDVY